MSEPSDFAAGHSWLDRALHRFAFATTWAQRGSADLELRMFRRELDAVDLGPPVLITALPRAGTTILLELLAGAAPFASHTYRDMPFVLCPMLWSRMSRRFQRDDAPRERAHGDGIQITHDSPEAFEEVIWRRFWPKHYRQDRIAPWTSCDDREFVEFYVANMRKVVALRARDKATARRYVAKNNLNVARIPAVLDALARADEQAVHGAVALVPFREPVQHVASLLNQHQRFLQMHEDPFARRYMRDIGHFDFGANLLPVDFGGWLDRPGAARDATQLAFWLDYWIATYQHVLAHAQRDDVHLVCFEQLGAVDVAPLAKCLGLDDPTELRQRSSMLKPPKPRDIDVSGLDAGRLREARDLYYAMCVAALQ
ncbi:MAG: hypothetical protein R3F29_00540 [Planctomycetota bacterium]